MAQTKSYQDKYAAIGSQEIKSTREKLVDQVPEVLPECYLPADRIDEQAVFHYESKEWTESRLEEALATQKAYYMPFFADYAPQMESHRTHRGMTTFDWRVGTDEDTRDFQRVLNGEGSWEMVQIPHFGEPLGVATTYYRTCFELNEQELARDSLWICFGAVDYKAHVYINGSLVGSHEGFFAPFEFAFTGHAKLGSNICVVVVENDFIPMGSNNAFLGEEFTGDKIYAQTHVGYDEPLKGWHHCPAGMGIWQDVYIEGRSHLFIHDIFVRPVGPEQAEVWVELMGTRVAKQEITLDVSLYGQNFKETVFEHMIHIPDLGMYDENQPGVTMKMERGLNYLRFPIQIPEARLWEPTEPWLYQIQIRLRDEQEQVIDGQKRQFGMRFFTFETEGEIKGVYRLNGRKIKCRGVNSQGWEQRRVFVKDFDSLLRNYLLAKMGNINYLRITQRPVQPEVYDYCDKLGLLVQTDFPAFGCFRRNTFAEALKQAQEMEHLIRSHPSCVVSSYINEPFPLGKWMPHRSMLRQEMEDFFACADRMIHILNPDRVIKPIDGDYDPPVSYGLPDYHCYTCWYNGHGIDLGMLHKGYWLAVKEGWNYGCGEYGMEGLDPVSLMKKYYPKEWLPEHDEDTWTPACIPGDPPPQLGFEHYNFYETPRTMAQWVEASQTYQATAMNFMTRAYRRNRRMISYAYHLYVDAYPNGWMKAMVDFEGTPKKAFWEFKEASAPLMVDLRTDRFQVWGGERINIETRVCNDLDQVFEEARVHYQAYLGDRLILAAQKKVEIPAADNLFTGYLPLQLPEVSDRTGLKVQIALFDREGLLRSSYELTLEVFPRTKPDLGKICGIGMTDEFAGKLRQMYEIQLVQPEQADENTAVLIFDLEQYDRMKDQLLAATQKGARLVFFRLPKGNLEIAGSSVEVAACSRRPVHFVTRRQEHPMVADFDTNDVRYWYDEEKGYISPILHEVITAEDFAPILTSAKRSGVSVKCPKGIWSVALAAGERSYGDGVIRLCQIDLQQRIMTNPAAKILLERLIVGKK